MASSLNLLVLRLAQFHSENGTGGISALLGRNEEDLIAAAIAHHRASIHQQQLNRICSNSTSNNLNIIHKYNHPYLPIGNQSLYTCSSSSASQDGAQIEIDYNSPERHCCSYISLCGRQKRRKRHWHLRRSPQNIKHLLYIDHLLENHALTSLRKSQIPLRVAQHNFISNPTSTMISTRQQRISI